MEGLCGGAVRGSGEAAPPMLIVLPLLCSLQMAEGVLKPETWAAIDDPFDKETDDEAAEEFQHM